MKDYSEMAESVFARREQYNAERAMAKNKYKKGLTGAACCCLIALLGVGVMRNHQTVPIDPDIPNPPVQNSTIKRPSGLSSGLQTEQENLVWLSVDEVLATDNNAYMGVCVPSFLSWKGGFYGATEIMTTDRFAPTEEEVWFTPESRYTIYQAKDRPDCIAIRINDGLQIYQKTLDVTFELDGITYGIQYNLAFNNSRTAGKAIMFGEDFTVYESICSAGNSICKGEYLVNILPLLQKYWPNIFGENENYADAWQVALPISGHAMDIPVTEDPGSTGALVAYDEIWGGSYLDKNGRWVIWLTENTPENQQEVFTRNPALNREATIFKTADYSYAYLTALMADISTSMGNNELPFVSTAALRDDLNRVEVRMTADDAESIARVLAYDPVGGAIEIRYASGYATSEEHVKSPVK